MNRPRDELPRAEWRHFFDMLTKDYEGAEVVIEVLNHSFGSQIEAERMPLAYLEYDDRDDIFSAAVGGRDGRYPVVLRHGIAHPEKIYAASALPGTPWAFEIVEPDGTQTIVTLHPRIALTEGHGRSTPEA
jgi:hypothetical protein